MKLAIISDTHGSHGLVPEMPEADVFIHAGDFMNSGRYWDEITSFNTWLETIDLPKNRKLVCAGNHDILFDEYHTGSGSTEARQARYKITNATYLQDEEIVINGLKFYFSPWTPYFMGWGFNVSRGPEIAQFWKKIPEDTNVLVTHGPPMGILDKVDKNEQLTSGRSPNLGCEDLNRRVQQLPNLKVHAFGHIHGSRGVLSRGILAKPVTYVNASFLNEAYRPHQGAGAGYTMVEI